MELPSSREIELETLLRQRDVQLVELTVRAATYAPKLYLNILIGRSYTTSPVSLQPTGAIYDGLPITASRLCISSAAPYHWIHNCGFIDSFVVDSHCGADAANQSSARRE